MFKIEPKKQQQQNRRKLFLSIYNYHRARALAAGFTQDEWWRKVMFFITDEFKSDPSDWATAGQLAYESLCAEEKILSTPERLEDYQL